MYNANEDDVDDGGDEDVDATPLLFGSSERRSALARFERFGIVRKYRALPDAVWSQISHLRSEIESCDMS